MSKIHKQKISRIYIYIYIFEGLYHCKNCIPLYEQHNVYLLVATIYGCNRNHSLK